MCKYVKQMAGVALCLFLMLAGECLWAKDKGFQPISFEDPWEEWNRSIFKFNDSIDTYIFRPVARSYVRYMPEPAQGLVSNFFHNIGDIRNAVNALFQLKLKNAGISVTRFIINSTIGQLGFVDVAGGIGIKSSQYQDFGLTLARWHVPSGPYLVLPFFGSSTVRSAAGLVPDAYTYPPNYMDVHTDITVSAVNILDKRASLLKTEKLVSGDKYSFIRDAYLQQRQFLITGKQPEDDF